MTGIQATYRNRDEWLAARRTAIGSSDAPVLWGVGYASQSPYALWAAKVHGVTTEFDDATVKRMSIGTAMEPALRKLFERETGLTVRNDEPNTIWHSAEHQHLAASLDSYTHLATGEMVPVELKNIGAHNAFQWDNGDCPLAYQVQVAHQAIVVGAPGGYVFALIGGDDPQVRWIPLTTEFREAHLELCRVFWQCVQSMDAPPVDSSPATGAALAKVFPRETAPLSEAGEWLDSVTAELTELDDKRKEIEAAIDLRRNRIKSEIGEATGLVSPNGVEWTWKHQERAGYYVEPSASRVLRRTRSGKRIAGS